MRKIKLIFTIFIALFGLLGTGRSAYAKEGLVIVIDPGHGGENLGGQYEEYREKDINPIVAQAMKEELEKYEGVTVYLTHEEDRDMSIEDRALFAKEKDADFLICLHFNMSVNHDLYGAEVWVPASGEYYAKGYALAEIQMQELTGLGLHSRGIKTRINDREQDYYGILRYCTREGIPSILVEHCHFDNPNDQPFYQEGEEQWKQLGILDATAVAKYFKLHSESLSVDYSDYPVSEISIPSGLVRPDETAPELCRIRADLPDKETGEVQVHVDAADQDGYIQYYSYSLNGGNSYSELFPWPGNEDSDQPEEEAEITINLPFDRNIELRLCVYNGYDKWTESNIVAIEPVADPGRLSSQQEMAKQEALQKKQESYSEIGYEELNSSDMGAAFWVIFWIVIISLCMTAVLLFMVKQLLLLLRGKRAR